ncbi:hypothetical protein PQQ96_23645 [Paraburkholderia sediminicola]|uniref:hypothetical protein n=1 Tax=Paraburkholderia sediminicola TaxID=458836 RepID=UPI0038BA1814
MSTHYHFTTVDLSPGSRLNPGNWGHFLRRYDIRNGTNAYMLSSELVLEAIRRAEFPDLPSRFDSIFVFDDEGVARARRPTEFAPHFRLYEVRIVDAAAPQHRAAFNLLSQRFPQPGEFFLPHAEGIAKRYWSGADIVIPEILTTSPIEIVRCLD